MNIVPWIFADVQTQVFVHAPATSGEPDVIVDVGLQRDDPAARRQQSYKIAYVGQTIDIGMDGRADVIVESEDWTTSQLTLGDRDDVLDLRKMTNLAYPVDKYGFATKGYGGCTCNGGNDVYYGNEHIGRTYVDLGAGNDRAWLITREFTTTHGGPGNDVIHGGPGSDVIYGGDTLPGGVDILFGHEGKDLLLKYGSGRAILNGGPGTDGLHGGAGNDVLIGGGPPFDRANYNAMNGAGGNDRYIGDASNDHVIDKWGSTIAYLGAGRDTIVMDPKRRHRINCGPGLLDWVKYPVKTLIGCERISGRK